MHKYMETIIGITLYSYLYLKPAKILCLSYYLLCFLFNKIGARGVGGKREQSEGAGGEMAEMMYTHMNK
jgi:hypothetical protein